MSKKLLIFSCALFIVLAGVLSYEIARLFMMSEEESKEIAKEETPIFEDDVSTAADLDLEEVVPAETVQLSHITPSTRIVYQYYYTVDDKLVTDECEPPYYLIDMTRQQLETYYKDWQLISFSEEKVVIRQSIHSRDTKGYYIIKAFEGKIAVFFDYTEDFATAFEEAVALEQFKVGEEALYFTEFMKLNKDKYLREIVNTPVSVLPETEQEKLKQGISVYGEDELIRFLENYTS
ncbi:MAG: hypothetical protein H7X94_05505 [Vallitaleaceae bacterium]|nr:hypothetical protein [Vallitaleaceae bacterium]